MLLIIFIASLVFIIMAPVLYMPVPKINSEISKEIINEMKEIMSVIVGESWDRASNMNGYNVQLIMNGLRVCSYEEKISMSSNGFDLIYNKETDKYKLSLHLGTSDDFYYEMLDSLQKHFIYVTREDGTFVKTFKFSHKKSPVKYYENDYLEIIS